MQSGILGGILNRRRARWALLSTAAALFLRVETSYAPDPPVHLSNQELQYFQSDVTLDPGETLEQHRSLYFVIGNRRDDSQQMIDERIETELKSAIRLGDRQRIVDLGRARYHLSDPARRRAYNNMLKEQDQTKAIKQRLEMIYGLNLPEGNLREKLSRMLEAERQKELQNNEVGLETPRHRAMRRLLRDYSGSFLAGDPSFSELNAYARALMGAMALDLGEGSFRSYTYGGKVVGGAVDRSIQRVFDKVISVARDNPALSRTEYQELFRTWEAVARGDGNYETSRARVHLSFPIPSSDWVNGYKRYGESGRDLMRALATDPNTDAFQRLFYLQEATYLLSADESYELLKDVVKAEAAATAKGNEGPGLTTMKRERLGEVVHDLVLRYPQLQSKIEAGASFTNYIASWFSQNALCEYLTAQLAF